jgi:hypothetical protein
VFGVQAFRLESQYLAPTVFQARKTTLTMPPRRISQHLSRPGATPLPSTQVLLDIAEGQEVEAFTEIEEVELQHTANVTGTSAKAAGSS